MARRFSLWCCACSSTDSPRCTRALGGGAAKRARPTASADHSAHDALAVPVFRRHRSAPSDGTPPRPPDHPGPAPQRAASSGTAALLGGLLGGWAGAWTELLWGSLVRLFFTHHVTWSVNSVCQMFDKRAFATNDRRWNEWVVGLLAFDEGVAQPPPRLPTFGVSGAGLVAGRCVGLPHLDAGAARLGARRLSHPARAARAWHKQCALGGGTAAARCPDARRRASGCSAEHGWHRRVTSDEMPPSWRLRRGNREAAPITK